MTKTGRKMSKSTRRVKTKGKSKLKSFGASSVKARLASEWPSDPKVVAENILIHAARRTLSDEENNKMNGMKLKG